jgi:hypothetical protein
MSVKDANIWKFGIFKKTGSLFSSNQRVQTCVNISETGIVSLEKIPMATGWMSKVESKESWMVDQRCLTTMEGCEELVMPISERSFEPLDPLGVREKGEEIDLNEIAWSKRREAFSRVMDENKTSASMKVMQTVLYGFLFITAVVLLIFFLKH